MLRLSVDIWVQKAGYIHVHCLRVVAIIYSKVIGNIAKIRCDVSFVTCMLTAPGFILIRIITIRFTITEPFVFLKGALARLLRRNRTSARALVKCDVIR